MAKNKYTKAMEVKEMPVLEIETYWYDKLSTYF